MVTLSAGYYIHFILCIYPGPMLFSWNLVWWRVTRYVFSNILSTGLFSVACGKYLLLCWLYKEKNQKWYNFHIIFCSYHRSKHRLALKHCLWPISMKDLSSLQVHVILPPKDLRGLGGPPVIAQAGVGLLEQVLLASNFMVW